jgi:hypothetical protein
MGTHMKVTDIAFDEVFSLVCRSYSCPSLQVSHADLFLHSLITLKMACLEWKEVLTSSGERMPTFTVHMEALAAAIYSLQQMKN